MGKKCCICSGKAEFYIKGTSDYYCKECAFEQFGDLAYLVKVEDEAQVLKEIIDEADEKSEKSSSEKEDYDDVDIAINDNNK